MLSQKTLMSRSRASPIQFQFGFCRKHHQHSLLLPSWLLLLDSSHWSRVFSLEFISRKVISHVFNPLQKWHWHYWSSPLQDWSNISRLPYSCLSAAIFLWNFQWPVLLSLFTFHGRLHSCNINHSRYSSWLRKPYRLWLWPNLQLKRFPRSFLVFVIF